MSRSCPFGWTQPQRLHSAFDSARRLAPGCSSMSERMKATSCAVTARPR